MLPTWFSHCEGEWRYLKMHYISWCQTESEYLTPSPDWPQALCRALRSNWKCLFMWWWAGDSGTSVWTVVEGLCDQSLSFDEHFTVYIYKYILRNFVINWISCHSKPVCLYLLLWNTQILMQLSVKQDILVNYLTFYSLNHAMTYRMSHGEYILDLWGGGLSHGVL